MVIETKSDMKSASKFKAGKWFYSLIMALLIVIFGYITFRVNEWFIFSIVAILLLLKIIQDISYLHGKEDAILKHKEE